MGLALINLGFLGTITDTPNASPAVHAVSVIRSPEPVSQPTQTVAKEDTPEQTPAPATPVAPDPPAPQPVPTPTPAAITPSGSHDDWLSQAGISDIASADVLIGMENGSWDPCKINGGAVDCAYTGDRAYGIPQALPGAKMASQGSDWQTNPITQLKWMNGYVIAKYGSWAGAVAFHVIHGWY